MGQNADTIRRLISEAWTGQHVDLVDELVAESYLEHAPFGDVIGIAGYREGIECSSVPTARWSSPWTICRRAATAWPHGSRSAAAM